MGIIYLITNLLNGKAYIGKTVSRLRVRWTKHRCEARKRLGMKHTEETKAKMRDKRNQYWLERRVSING